MKVAARIQIVPVHMGWRASFGTKPIGEKLEAYPESICCMFQEPTPQAALARLLEHVRAEHPEEIPE